MTPSSKIKMERDIQGYREHIERNTKRILERESERASQIKSWANRIIEIIKYLERRETRSNILLGYIRIFGTRFGSL